MTSRHLVAVPTVCAPITQDVGVGYGLWTTAGALVVVTLSADASGGVVVRPRSESSAVWRRVGPSQSAIEYALVEVGRNESMTAGVEAVAAWCVVAVRYVGTASLTGATSAVSVPMSEVLGCPVSTAGGAALGLLSVTLEDSPPLPPNVGVVTDTTVVVTAATGSVAGVTAGIVQSGIANAMLGMLRCSEFDAEAEVDFVSNPGGWAVGRAALQYQRGSLLLVLILMSCVLCVCGCVVCVLYVRGERRAGLLAAVGEARLPSLLLVPVMVSSSMALPSGTSVLLYGDSSTEDYVLAVAVMVPLWAYLLLFAYRSTVGLRVGLERIPVDAAATRRLSGLQRVARFMMEPTYGPVVPSVRARNFAADVDGMDDGAGGVHVVGAQEDPEAPEPWLRRNYFFVADRRWAGYGGVEAIVGSLVDMLEGIPLTTRSVTVCVARPAAMCTLLLGMMVLLVVKRPNAVRFQQFSALAVTGLLLVANVLVIVNAAIVAPDLEAAAGQLIGTVSLVIVVLSMLDLLATVASMVPALRRSLGISGTSLSASLGRLRSAIDRKKKSDEEAHAAQPLLPLPPPRTEDDDDVSDDHSAPSEAGSPTTAKHIAPQPTATNQLTPIELDDDDAPPIAPPTAASSTSRPPPQSQPPTRFKAKSSPNCPPGMYRDLGDAAAFEEELEAMKTPAEIEAEQMRLFTEEVMRDL